MLDVKHLEQQINYPFLEDLLAHTYRSFPWCLCVKRKTKRLADGQSCIMHVVFLVVHGLSTKLFGERTGIIRTKEYITRHRRIAIALVCDHLEERGAATSGSPEDEYHFSGLCDAAKGLENIELGAFLTPPEKVHERPWDIKEADEGIWKCPNNVLGTTDTFDRQIVPDDTNTFRLDAGCFIMFFSTTQGLFEIKCHSALLRDSFLEVLFGISSSVAIAPKGADATRRARKVRLLPGNDGQLLAELCKVGFGAFNGDAVGGVLLVSLGRMDGGIVTSIVPSLNDLIILQRN